MTPFAQCSTLVVSMVVAETNRWSPGIGDPTFIGWFTVLAYLGATVLSGMNLADASRLGLPRRFWIGMTALLLALGINKQLDLQTWLTEVGRDMAVAEGWYQQRRVVQAAFVGTMTAGALLIVAFLRIGLAGSWADYRLTVLGVALLMLFVLVRAASIHHVDMMLGLDLYGVTMNAVLELGGIAVTSAGAWHWRLRKGLRLRRYSA